MTELVDLTKTEGTVRNVRNFRSASDVENFYRFVSDNELRREAKLILDFIVSKIKKPRKRKKKLQ